MRSLCSPGLLLGRKRCSLWWVTFRRVLRVCKAVSTFFRVFDIIGPFYVAMEVTGEVVVQSFSGVFS